MAKGQGPAIGEHVAIVYSKADGDEMVGSVQQLNANLVMVKWPNNPIEDWVEVASLRRNKSKDRWEMDPEG